MKRGPLVTLGLKGLKVVVVNAYCACTVCMVLVYVIPIIFKAL